MNTPTPEEIVAMSDIIDKHYPNSDYVSYSDIRAMMFEYAASLNRQGWTRVEDGLPKQGQRVLIATNTGNMEVGYYYKGYWERNWAGTTFGEAGYQITNWMPLPNKPI